MADFKKYPVYIYNEPATYQEFFGGINLDPSGQADHELKDAVNMHYSHTTLEKRKGATKIAGLNLDTMANNVQGLFLFTGQKNSFVVVAADGKFYYSLYVPEVDFDLKYLPIHSPPEGEGKELNQFGFLEEFETYQDHAMEHKGYIYTAGEDGKELIFQNVRKIEASAYDNNLYVATGTRLVKIQAVDSDEVELKAETILPYKPGGAEYNDYGANNLSPFPHLCINTEVYDKTRTDIKGLITTENSPTQTKYTAVMSYLYKTEADNYNFKWEVKDPSGNWHTIHKYKNNQGPTCILRNTISLDGQDYDLSRCLVRCSCCDYFKTDGDGEKEEKDNDWIPALEAAVTSSFSKKGFTDNETPHRQWRIINSCCKIVADGNKFILYDDDYNSGLWFKTVTGNPSYITDRGSLSFKTNKNEQVIKVVHFKGAIVVFAHNKKIGGNISIVTGHGDDYFRGSDYSPYTKKIVNSVITCDNADTVQVAENFLLFKMKKTVYAIEGSALSNEVVSVHSMNDKINMPNQEVDIPWDEPCVSELTQNYYGLIWKEKINYENGEVYIERPAMRLKMYYKIGSNIQNKIFLPWLRDEGTVFNVDQVLNIDGISTHLHDFSLIQYEKENYTDLGKEYTALIRFKDVGLNYPQMLKYINNVLLYYNRGQYTSLDMSLKVKNEAGHTLIDDTYEKESLQDQPSFKLGMTGGKIGTTSIETRVFNPAYRFPLLTASTCLEIRSKDSFVFHSITYNYTATDVPQKTMYNEYNKIIRKSTPITGIKPSLHAEREYIEDTEKVEPNDEVVTPQIVVFDTSLDSDAEIIIDGGAPE